MKKHILITGLIFLLLFSSVFPMSIGSDVKIPDIKEQLYNLGNTLYVGGNGPNNYTKIQDAINNANNGDTVFVYDDSSPYYENIVIDKSISLMGENKVTTIIDANWMGSGIIISADWVIISGFTIKNGYTNYTISTGISISSHNNTIKNNIISNNFISIEISSSINDTFNDNIISNNTIGIHINNSKFNTIINNKIYNNKWPGIELLNSNSNMIIGNNLSSNTLWGIYLARSHNNLIESNDISFDGIALYNCTNNTITSNKIISSNKPGLYIQGG